MYVVIGVAILAIGGWLFLSRRGGSLNATAPSSPPPKSDWEMKFNNIYAMKTEADRERILRAAQNKHGVDREMAFRIEVEAADLNGWRDSPR